MGSRAAELTRETRETSIRIRLDLDGSGSTDISTGMGFADHLLTLMAFWARFDLWLHCEGDLEVDAHHSLEDIGLCLGEVLGKALGDKQGIGRVGWAKVPMDEALTEIVVDISGRPYFVYREEGLLPPTIAGQEKDVWREFFKSFAFRGQMNLHMDFAYGQNGHHLLESAVKGLGLALGQAVAVRGEGVFSTKGSLD